MTEPLSTSLDPSTAADWAALRAQGHHMLDDMFEYLQALDSRPVWQPIPPEVRHALQEPLPKTGRPLAEAHHSFMTQILPYAVGNAHPRFMGWVQGGGTAVGMLAEMLAAGLNANVGGRDQMPLEVERQIVQWMRELFHFPDSASGLLVTGSSMANFLGVLIARTQALGIDSRRTGVSPAEGRLVAYAASSAHGCIAQAMAMSGLGSDALRRIPVDAQHRMDIDALVAQINADCAAGLQPFLLVGTAGSVDVGAIDPLATLAEVARRERLWFHVDGAFGALGCLSPTLAPRLRGIELADSIALDFHKWGQVPYDAGFILVRDGADQLAAFASPAAYLSRHPRGLAAGSPWPCDLGPDLSRGFRALKTWFTLVTHGTDRLGAAIANTCALAQQLAHQVTAHPDLELMAPVTLNIVCLRYRPDCTGQNGSALPPPSLDELNQFHTELAADLHEAGDVAPSTTTLNGQVVIRVALVNHRTQASDLDRLLGAITTLGAARWATRAQPQTQLAAHTTTATDTPTP